MVNLGNRFRIVYSFPRLSSKIRLQGKAIMAKGSLFSIFKKKKKSTVDDAVVEDTATKDSQAEVDSAEPEPEPEHEPSLSQKQNQNIRPKSTHHHQPLTTARR